MKWWAMGLSWKLYSVLYSQQRPCQTLAHYRHAGHVCWVIKCPRRTIPIPSSELLTQYLCTCCKKKLRLVILDALWPSLVPGTSWTFRNLRWKKKKVNAVYPYSGIFSAVKRNEFLTHASAWMNLEHMMLSKISKTHKDKYSKIPLTWGTWSGHICGDRK